MGMRRFFMRDTLRRRPENSFLLRDGRRQSENRTGEDQRDTAIVFSLPIIFSTGGRARRMTVRMASGRM